MTISQQAIPQITSTNTENSIEDNLSTPQEYFKRLFVKGLKATTTQQDLLEYLAQFGQESDFIVELTTNKNKKHRGFAFVTILSESAYEKICSQEHHVHNTKLEIKDALSKDDIIEQERMLTLIPRKIFIGGIPQNTTREELYEYFERYGEIEDLNLTFKRENKGKGFGF